MIDGGHEAELVDDNHPSGPSQEEAFSIEQIRGPMSNGDAEDGDEIERSGGGDVGVNKEGWEWTPKNGITNQYRACDVK